MKSFFEPNDVEAVVGLSYRQIQYWDSSDFIKPSYKKHGRYRCYTFEDLVTIQVIDKVNREGKVSIQKMRKSLLPAFRSMLKKLTQPLVNYQIIVLKKGQILMYTGDLLVHGDLNILYHLDVSQFADLIEEKLEGEESKSLEGVPLVTEFPSSNP